MTHVLIDTLSDIVLSNSSCKCPRYKRIVSKIEKSSTDCVDYREDGFTGDCNPYVKNNYSQFSLYL